MATILGSVTLNQLQIVELDSFPTENIPEIEAGDIVLINNQAGIWQRSGTGPLDYIRLDGWSKLTSENTFSGTLSLTNTSDPIRIFNGTIAGLTVKLPEATTLVLGKQFYLINDSTQIITVNDFGDGLVYSLKAGSRILLFLENNSSSAGIWTFDDGNKIELDSHTANTSNPHSTTKAQVGLGNADNTSDLDKPVSTATQTALNLKYDANNPNGYETPSQLNSRDTANRNRDNHTGSQLSSTISDFAATVRSTLLTGLSLATNAVISATDTILEALGKLQAQITNFTNNTFSVYATTLFETTSSTLTEITSFSITPTRAGTYQVFALLSATINTNNTRTIGVAIFKNGAEVTNSLTNSGCSDNGMITNAGAMADEVSMNGTTDVLTVAVQIIGGNTLSITNRKLKAIRTGP